jgi:hypothetical protein
VRHGNLHLQSPHRISTNRKHLVNLR